MFLLTKRVGETLQNVGIDFSDRLLSTETISTGSASCTTAGIVTGSAYSTTQVVCDLAAGVDGNEYVIEYTATGSLGSILEAEILLCIKEV